MKISGFNVNADISYFKSVLEMSLFHIKYRHLYLRLKTDVSLSNTDISIRNTDISILNAEISNF